MAGKIEFKDYVIAFKKGVTLDEAKGALTAVFTKHGKGAVSDEKHDGRLPNSILLVVTDIDKDVIDDLRKTPAVHGFFPNAPLK